MTVRWRLLSLALAMAGALLLFHQLQQRLVAVLPGPGFVDEMVAALERSQADLKDLARVAPARGGELHRRFDEVQALANRLRILRHNRQELAERQQALVLGAAVIAVAALGLVIATHARRDARRLGAIGQALADLAAGARDIRLSVRGGDAIGRVARMIEETSDVVTRERQRLASLRNLAAWQEAARRQAHELRTPLTVARLELGRIEEGLATLGAEGRAGAGVARSLAEVRAELGRLDERVQQFAAFAKLPPPERRRQDVGELLRDFAATFGAAWPGLALEVAETALETPACFDRAMIRQVLVNLCDNTARALAGGAGRVRLSARAKAGSPWVEVDVSDDGPGIADAVRARLFEPYVTTAAPGQGMGLGLAICRKTLLDHGGDLEAVEAPRGATFRLRLPVEVPCPA